VEFTASKTIKTQDGTLTSFTLFEPYRSYAARAQ